MARITAEQEANRMPTITECAKRIAMLEERLAELDADLETLLRTTLPYAYTYAEDQALNRALEALRWVHEEK